MAIYHCSIKIGSRHGTKSSVAAAAYRAGQRLTDERTGKIYDYTRKKEVVHSEIMCPEAAPSSFYDRAALWNSVERAEKQENAQLYREFELALPRELSREHQIQAAREFFQKRVDEGMIVDWSLHAKEGNPHVHGIAPTRGLKPDGTWAAKRKQIYETDKDGNRVPVIDPTTGQQKIGARGRKMWKRITVEANEWNSRDKAEQWRAEWAEVCNRYLQLERSEERVDHRSYERQGVDLVPTKHEGVAARKIEDRGGVSEIRRANRLIRKLNEFLRRAEATGRKLIEQFRQISDRFRKEMAEDYGAELSAGEIGTNGTDEHPDQRTAGHAETIHGRAEQAERGKHYPSEEIESEGKRGRSPEKPDRRTEGDQPEAVAHREFSDELREYIAENDRLIHIFNDFLDERDAVRRGEIMPHLHPDYDEREQSGQPERKREMPEKKQEHSGPRL